MDLDLEKKVNEAIEALQKILPETVDYVQMDPVARMMLVSLINETQKLKDYTDSISQRIVERFCADFIPPQKVSAMPAVCLVQMQPTEEDTLQNIGTGVSLSYKTEGIKAPLNYIPIFNTTLLPNKGCQLLTCQNIQSGQRIENIRQSQANTLWVGIQTKVEIDSIQGLSLLLKGTKGIHPEHIYAGAETKEIEFATMLEMEDIEMAEPFDAQQASGSHFAFVENWKEYLLNLEDATLIYITERTRDRDMFKLRACPRALQELIDNDTLQQLNPDTLWLRIDFPAGYKVPDNCEVMLNVMPVTNVDVNTLTLTQTQPIAKLQRGDASFYLGIIETSNASHQQGFNMNADEIIIRDFEAKCYDNGDLYRDIRNLYNRFLDDYYAFIEYNNIKDGEVLKQLREIINKLGKSVGTRNDNYLFDSGTYVMKNMNLYPPTSSIRVTYITTQGKMGNSPRAGQTLGNREVPGVEQKVTVLTQAMGGVDKASADERYELLRYYSLTNDRLYTRMDIDAFLRKEIMAEYGREEARRIFIKLCIQGAGGATQVQRGLYIDIEFKDRKNYQHALDISFDLFMKQKIVNKSCISMPIVVTLKNLED